MRPIRRSFTQRSAGLVILAAAACLVGFIRISFEPTSPGFRWPTSSLTYVIQAAGSDDVPDQSDHAAIRLAFQSWENVFSSQVVFQEDLTADANRTDFDAGDIHLVIWDEDGSSGFFAPGSNIIALTPLLASTVDGTILDADIVFNGSLEFTTNPAAQPDRFDIQAVATHEIGHFIGLDHSGGPRSTMFSTVESGDVGARTLSRDEEAAAVFLYPAAGVNRGRITGSVVIQGGGPVAYGQVVAVDQGSGEYAGCALTDANGSFAIEALPGGTYDLYVEPVDGPFHVNDTIGFFGETPSVFAATWNPGNPVTISAGQTGNATWGVDPTQTMNVDDAFGGVLTAGGGSLDLLLFGTGLADVTGARITGSGVTVETIADPSFGSVRLVLSASAAAARGVRCVELSKDSGEITVLTAGVEVLDTPPAITQVTPDTPLAAQGGQNVTIDGTGFFGGAAVVIGGQLATGVVVQGSARITCVSPPSPGASGPVDVVVIRSDGLEARAPGGLVYDTTPVPQSIDPALGPIAGGTTHTVRGVGFSSGARVFFGAVEAQVLSISASEIQVRLPPQAAGTVDIRVQVGSQTGVLSGAFSYVDATAPVATSFTPTTGPTGGGTQVVIRGSGFEPTTTVTFGGVAASSVTFDSPTQLTAVTPGHPSGGVELRVTNPSTGLNTIAPGLFSYGDAPPEPSSGGGSSSGCQLSPGRSSGTSYALWALLGLLLAARRRR